MFRPSFLSFRFADPGANLAPHDSPPRPPVWLPCTPECSALIQRQSRCWCCCAHVGGGGGVRGGLERLQQDRESLQFSSLPVMSHTHKEQHSRWRPENECIASARLPLQDSAVNLVYRGCRRKQRTSPPPRVSYSVPDASASYPRVGHVHRRHESEGACQARNAEEGGLLHTC